MNNTFSNLIKAFLLTYGIFLIACILGILFFSAWFFTVTPPIQKNITWGVNFSQTEAENLSLDWKQTYLAILEDLQIKNIKLITDWDKIETNKNTYNFDDIDWQIMEAQTHNASIIYVLGLKSGRWPECHVPGWADSMTLTKQQQQDETLNYLQQVVQRYQSNSTIIAWQIENEPLVDFGECPSWYYTNSDFLKKEIALVKSLDPTRQVIISDSGEGSQWLDAGQIGDMVATTLYRKVWVGPNCDVAPCPATTDTLNSLSNAQYGFYKTYDLTPASYWRKAQILYFLFGKKVIVGELQAEPWSPQPFWQVSLQEQEKTMSLQKLKDNIFYAKQTGMDEFYLWGTEWWFWLKQTQNKPEIWNEAKKLFQQ